MRVVRDSNVYDSRAVLIQYFKMLKFLKEVKVKVDEMVREHI